MAFSTIQGSGGAPDSFVGTSGVDNLVVTTLPGAAFIGAEESGDTVQFNTVSGSAGNVTVRGGQGNDQVVNFGTSFFLSDINGNSGTDTITANIVSSSTIRGGQGNDTINLNDNLVNSLVNGNKDSDTILMGASITIQGSSVYGGGGNDILTFTATGSDLISDSKFNGNNGNDVITINMTGQDAVNTTFNGGQGNDVINAGASTVSVTLSGDDGDDNLIGSTVSDVIYGGSGDDAITGANGADVMSGGGGINTFNFADEASTLGGTLASGSIDVITDFTTTDFIAGFGVAGTGEFSATADGNNFGSYAAALAGANTAIVATNNDYVLSAYGSGSAWTAVLFIDIGAAGGTGAAVGAIQIGATGGFATEVSALDALVAADILA